MAIYFDQETKTFHLQTSQSSYLFQVVNNNYLAHLYWGKRVRSTSMPKALRYIDRGFSGNPNKEDRTFSLDTLPQEYPSYGHTDFRSPALHIESPDGSRITDLRYVSHEIEAGKQALTGLPSTYVEDNSEADTLKVYLIDALTQLHVTLIYTVYSTRNVITRSVLFENKGTDTLSLQKVASMSVDFRDTEFEMINLPGAHVRERDIERLRLRRGMQSIESRRGSSSHHQNPFIALVREETTETKGDVYGLSFVYSGNFKAEVEIDQTNQARVMMGINDFDFNWILKQSSVFQTPEVVMVYTDQGLNDMSKTYHDLYGRRLARGKHRDKQRPVLINNWEATYFDFNEDKILTIADKAKDAGVELFVLDDGWFGQRDDDFTSLGDWFVDEAKLPNGLKSLAEKINAMGMQFGLWFEPEMVSPESELYKAHPDWCLHVPNRRRSESRNQLVLDFSRPDVCQEMITRVSAILESAPISYVKWDMNRNMTEIGSSYWPKDQQQEVAHRYMLGLYHVMETITSRFPEILFESCSGGGGRFDPGMLHYMPQTWTSDNTDAISRLRIQYGTSLVYPISSMGSHVSEVPNHQVGRTTPLETRGHVAMDGNLGYELDVTKLSDEEIRGIKDQVDLYKSIRKTIQYGDFYRLVSPFETSNYGSIHVNKSKDEAVFIYVHTLAEANGPFKSVKLLGLDPDKDYRIIETGDIFSGDSLMHIGLNVPFAKHDFKSTLYRLEATN
ncbi:alpha-galactosidase [Halolactibacillus alkaliphilus]|uniref:Alpha-galactosidase n=1 Tax=Halolactibacillus alkaliphilus TaxID=442899 RepID=A0A511X221_9BACI|nr:alpha-galactosidase [Halolactibacillus alkaliphilus]GEN56996.1 alpha-galactosidase [Halolactibacillus alkaliphilus]GGN71645.1 alpha-galactosidase [Halolactibacillus alkaliphilus]SFO84974.1 alpha-galactosidase [Halolactibacillus alkaliphilus]